MIVRSRWRLWRIKILSKCWITHVHVDQASVSWSYGWSWKWYMVQVKIYINSPRDRASTWLKLRVISATWNLDDGDQHHEQVGSRWSLSCEVDMKTQDWQLGQVILTLNSWTCGPRLQTRESVGFKYKLCATSSNPFLDWLETLDQYDQRSRCACIHL